MKTVIILGGTGTCLDIADTIARINKASPTYRLLGHLDDNPKIEKQLGSGWLGTLDRAHDHPDAFFINGLGSPQHFRLRSEIVERLHIPLDRFETVIDPTCVVSATAQIGSGSVLLPHAAIGAGATIGQQVLILPGSIISHNCQIANFTCIASNAVVCGYAQIGEACYLGANASIREKITVGRHTLIGIGSVVITDCEDNSIYAGVPAKKIKSLGPS